MQIPCVLIAHRFDFQPLSALAGSGFCYRIINSKNNTIVKQTKLFLSLLVLVVFGIGNVWGAEVSLTQNEIKKSTANNSYKETSVVSVSGTWSGKMIVNTATGYVQINKNNNNYYLNSPVFAGGVTQVVIYTCNDTSKDRTFYIRSNTQTAQPTSGDYGSGKITTKNGSVTISVEKTPSSFYIYSDGAAYISSVVVTYETGSSTEPSLDVDKTEIDFGTVEQGATVAAQAIAVKMANVETIMAGFETGCTAFSVSPGELSTSGDLTITPNTSVTVGEYTSTLTITDADKLSKEVKVKMNVVKPFDGKTWEINTTNFDKVGSGSGYNPYNGQHTLNDISYVSLSVMPQSSSLQFKKSEGYIYNTTNFGKITKIEITTQSGKSNNLIVYFGNAQNPSKGNVNGTVDGAVTTYVAPDNCGFFKLKNGNDITNITSIKVYYYAVTSLSITVDENAKGKVMVDKKSAVPGEIVTLSAIPNKHYKFNGWLVYDDDMNEYEVDAENNTFKMPSVSVHVDATFVDSDKYTIIISANDAKFGTAVFDGFTEDTKEIYVDDDYTITATPTTDYRFVNWTADPEASVDFADAKAQTTQFTVLGEAIIQANFEPIPIQTPATITLWENGVENPSKLNGNVGEAIALPATAGGNCNKAVEFVGWSEVKIANSANAPADKFYAPGTTYTIQQENTTLYAVYAKKKTEGAFRKVTTVPADWSGEYLIVNEENSVVFNGSIDGNFDVVNNNKAVAITDNTIAIKDGEDYTFMIAKSGTEYTLQSKSGYYIGGKSSTGIDYNKNNSFVHTFEVTSSGVTIQTQYDGSARYLRYNATSGQNRFRYYNSSVTVKDVTLYVKKGRTYAGYSTTCAEAVEVAKPTFSVAGGEYSEAQSVEISCATEGATIYYTLDGTEPTNASTKYAGAINVMKSMTIKAIAYVGDDNYSDVAVAEYVVLQDAEVKWQTYAEDGSTKVDLTEATIYTDGDLDIYVYTPSDGVQTFTSTEENVAVVEKKTGNGGLEYLELSVKGAGTTTITVNVAKDETYVSGSASFVLHVIEHKTIVRMSFAAASYDATLGEEFTAPALTVSPLVAPVVYSSSDENAARVDATTGEITLVGMGTTTITATYAGDETLDPATAQYTLNVTDPTVDIITAADLAAKKNSEGYVLFTGLEGTASKTLYAGKTAKSDKGYIQLRSSKSDAGIVSTQSKGFIKRVMITFDESGTIDIYGNISAYTSAEELYATDGNTNQGVKIGSVSGASGETKSFSVVAGNYPYIGICSNKGAVYIKQIAIAWTPTEVVRMGLTEGKFGTICLEKSVTTSLGASFYEIAYREDQNGEPYKVLFDEVKTLEAGVPYIFLAEDEQITVVYGDETATAAGSRNGLVGTFAAIQDGAAGTAGNTLENNYLVNNNQIRKCGGNCSLPANRAYIRMGDVSTLQTAPQPGRRRVTLQNAATGTATGWEGITEDSTLAPQQEGIYDVLGRKLESAESGFYIINGKKQVIVK